MKATCLHGHAMTGHNLFVDTDGYVRCRACRNLRNIANNLAASWKRTHALYLDVCAQRAAA